MKGIKSWLRCTKCKLSKHRRKVVLGRGHELASIAPQPADILFVGEAPGKSEDLLGEAFVGPSGRILNAAITDAAELISLSEVPSYYITNIVACRPTDQRHGPNREPTGEEAWACWPRLQETHHLVQPKLVILLGKVAERYCKNAWPSAMSLVHPAYILRQGGERSTEYRRFCRGLADKFSLLTEEE